MHLERLTWILEIIGQKGEATVSDICAHSDLPKPTAYRLVQDLLTAGLLEPVAKGRYTIGSRLRRILQSDHSDAALTELIAPMLKQAALERNVTFFLSRLRGRSVEIIHVETPGTGVSYLHPGLGRRPLHACSCSKAVAAFNPELEFADHLDVSLKAYTEFTITRVADLTAEMALIRERGYAECVEEIERGMCSVAAPLGKSGFGATLSIGATGSVRIFTSDYRANIGKDLTRLAGQISEKLALAKHDEPQSGLPDKEIA